MDLRTTYLGLELEHPIVASSSPLSKDLDGIKRLAEAGASAIILFSLFEEQIQKDRESLEFIIDKSSFGYAESLSFFPEPDDYDVGPYGYLELIHQASRAVDVPIIGSLNGVSEHGWSGYAKDMVSAGAAAIELNVYFLPVDLEISSQEVEEQYLRVVRTVRDAVEVPIAVKLSPYFSSTGNMAKRLVAAGANGLVLFNSFYQPDFDIEKRLVESRLELSQPAEIRLPLLWLSVLYGKLECSLGATTGVQSEREVVKYLMAGADAVMSTSALLRAGEEHLGTLVKGLGSWMDRHGYESVAQMKGSMSLQNCAEPEALVRANYIKMLQSYRQNAFSR